MTTRTFVRRHESVGDVRPDSSVNIQDVDVLVWWRDVGQARFPRISVMSCQFLAIPAASATAERVFSFAGPQVDTLRPSQIFA